MLSAFFLFGPVESFGAVADGTSKQSKFTDKVHLSYYGDLVGPSFADPISSNSAGGSKISLYNSVTASVDAFEKFTFKVNPRFSLTPFHGAETTLLDPRLKLSYTEGWSIGDLNFSGTTLAFQIAATNGSHENRHLVAPYFSQNMSLNLGKSRFSLQNSSYVRAYIHANSGTGRDYEVYFNPAIVYQATPSLKAALTYEYVIGHEMGLDEYKLQSFTSAIKPMAKWQAMENLAVNPYVMVNTIAPEGADKASLGMELVGTLF
ncbi:MAG: hypothetical protein CL678_03575 [Bdellovibrionaceae bacterium]|nr:hypothetical protein [Pseudobdellovibrionaceae bacterium]|tara:strand:+ start:7631 stop:8416 length:786 start_codon:yes stop_codon:yes gene_type:complete